jgi:hypothetical protein
VVYGHLRYAPSHDGGSMWIMLLMGSGWFVRDRAGQLGENGESVMDHKFGAPMVVVPPVSIKDRVGCAPL